MSAVSNELTLELNRVIPAAPRAVFAALSSEQLAEWWGPKGLRAGNVDFEPRVGDGYRIEMQPSEGDHFYIGGQFREVDSPDRLAFTFAYEDPDPDDVENLVELSFGDLGESTEVALTQRPFKTEARRELHRNGWSDSFDRLEDFISKR